MNALPVHRYRGARALILLHEEELQRFLDVWAKAKAEELLLPRTDDPDYDSLELLLRHVMGCARNYMIWITKQLGLPDPSIDEVPEFRALEAEVEDYMTHLLARWRTPLADVDPQRFSESYAAPWKSMYCIDGMLEHAVMHPLRHRFQLEELIAVRD